MPSGAKPADMQFVDYVVKSGRALIYPIYTCNYQRFNHRQLPAAMGSLGRSVENSKAVRRSIDYPETRPDIDKSRPAYSGFSQGTTEGVIYVAMEPRFKTAVFPDGSFSSVTAAPDRTRWPSRRA